MKVNIKKINKDIYEVFIEAKLNSTHEIKISDSVFKELTNEIVSKEELLKFSFNFLLSKESNTSILKYFEIMLINQYFPDYVKKVRDWIGKVKNE